MTRRAANLIVLAATLALAALVLFAVGSIFWGLAAIAASSLVLMFAIA